MKKILIIIPLLISTAFAQNGMTTKSDLKSKSESLDQSNPLDGKAFNITFAVAGEEEKANNSSPIKNSDKKRMGNEVGDIDHNQNQLSDQSNTSLLTHKHAILRFQNGTIQSSALSKQNMNSCGYHITAMGSQQLYSFTSSCTMTNSVNTSSENNSNLLNGENSEIKTSPENNNLPGGNNMVNKGIDLSRTMVDTLADSQSPKSTYLQKSSSTVYMSGLIDGNTITGTLTCWMADGKSVKYSFAGTKASKSDINSESELGMR